MFLRLNRRRLNASRLPLPWSRFGAKVERVRTGFYTYRAGAVDHRATITLWTPLATHISLVDRGEQLSVVRNNALDPASLGSISPAI